MRSALRAYNKRRRVNRARRISAIFRLLGSDPHVTGRELAARLRVSEATVSRDLRFVRRVKADWQKDLPGRLGYQMHARNFFWLRDALGHGTIFEIRDGVRVR